MLGLKHSLNVASAGAIVMYELLRKYRALHSAQLMIGARRDRPAPVVRPLPADLGFRHG